MRSASPAERRPWRGDRGSATAEFAMVLPAVLLVLACCLAGVQLAATQLRLQDAAGEAARSLARGTSPDAVSTRAALHVSGVRLTRNDRSGMVCVRLSAPGAHGPLSAITVTAASCALAVAQ